MKQQKFPKWEEIENLITSDDRQYRKKYGACELYANIGDCAYEIVVACGDNIEAFSMTKTGYKKACHLIEQANTTNKTKYILSFSGGKDSTFLLLELIRRKYPLDEVVFFDTGWEFAVMYEHIEKCKKICEEHGIKFVTLHPEKSFDYWMFEHKQKNGITGFSWCGGLCRWGTRLKIAALDKYIRQNKGSIIYVGIAADETERLEKEQKDFKRFPLADWGITEAECLQGCYNAGFDWGGMYEHLDRLSCKFCKNKNLKELRNIRKFYPKEWQELKEYQRRTDRPYKGEGKSVFDLERRFAFEDERLKAGLSITNREFHKELKKRLNL